MANPETRSNSRDTASLEAVKREEEKRLTENMNRFNAMEREEAMRLAREKGVEKYADNYFLIKDYNDALTGGTLDEDLIIEDYSAELQSKHLRKMASGGWLDQIFTVEEDKAAGQKPEVVAASKEKKEDKKKPWYKRAGTYVLTGALALAILAGGVGLHNAKKLANEDKLPGNDGNKTEDQTQLGDESVEDEADKEQENTVEANMERYYGDMDNYHAPGLYYSEDNARFANAGKVHEALGEDATNKDIVVAVSSQTEALSDYIGSMPDEFRPDGFEGMSILEVQEKLDGMTKAEREQIRQEFVNTIYSSDVVTEDIELNGDFNNAMMIEHSKDNLELVRTVTHEEGTKATALKFMKDGKEVGQMIVKVDKDGEDGCVQVGEEIEEESKSFKSMKVVTVDREDKPVGDPVDPPKDPKDPKEPKEPKDPKDPKEPEDPKDPETPPEEPETPPETPPEEPETPPETPPEEPETPPEEIEAKDETNNTNIENKIDGEDGGTDLSGGEANTNEYNQLTEMPDFLKDDVSTNDSSNNTTVESPSNNGGGGGSESVSNDNSGSNTSVETPSGGSTGGGGGDTSNNETPASEPAPSAQNVNAEQAENAGQEVDVDWGSNAANEQ